LGGGVAIAASLIFSQVIESSDNTWQVVIAVIALAVGIPHGALDHLVTLPKSSAVKMAGFITVYVAVAVIAVILLLTWNVAGIHFRCRNECSAFWYWGCGIYLGNRSQIFLYK
jgi:beta-carotene 15,15'-dioxygenase